MRRGGAARRGGVRDERGFSLLELMIALLVMSVTVGAIYALFFSSLKAYWKGDVARQSQQSARVAVDQVSRDLRTGRRITSLTCTGTPQITFVPPLTSTPPTGVALNDTGNDQIFGAALDGSGNVQDGSAVSYYLSATAGGGTASPVGAAPLYLVRSVSGGGTQTIASNILDLEFFPGATCPSSLSGVQEVPIKIVALVKASGQGVQAQDAATTSGMLRNSFSNPIPATQ